MKKYAAYIRVSTVRQGEKGTSLLEQKAAIERYAHREGLLVSSWFEEKETAAKVGRSVFMAMLKKIHKGEFEGLILHKIDRGARNLKDWAELSHLSDAGIDVRVAGDSVDLTSRGGRLSADIQAVVAADYIRNLRDEVKKGQRGRLKQGLFPWAAPYGYISQGPGKPHAVDPAKAPLVRSAFEAYATGEFSIKTLRHHMAGRGLVTPTGGALSVNSMHHLLTRTYYFGLIQVRNESFAGIHEPIISARLFTAAQDVLHGRAKRQGYGERYYIFQQKIKCRNCSKNLYAETQKGHVYYRCHQEGCQGVCISEKRIRSQLRDIIYKRLGDGRNGPLIRKAFDQRMDDMSKASEKAEHQSSLRRGNLNAQLERLTDAYLDQAIDRPTYETRKQRILVELLAGAQAPVGKSGQFETRVAKFLELLDSLRDMEEAEFTEDQRRTIRAIVSNLVASGKSVDIYWRSGFSALFDGPKLTVGGAAHDTYRTLSAEVAEKVVDEVFDADDGEWRWDESH